MLQATNRKARSSLVYMAAFMLKMVKLTDKTNSCMAQKQLSIREDVLGERKQNAVTEVSMSTPAVKKFFFKNLETDGSTYTRKTGGLLLAI